MTKIKVLPALICFLLTFCILEAQDAEVQQALGEIVEASASGASAGTLFIAAVSGQETSTLASIATATINGYAESIAESAADAGVSINGLLDAVKKASTSTNGLLDIAQAVAEFAEESDIQSEELSQAISDFQNGDVTEEELNAILQETVESLPNVSDEFKGILNQMSADNPQQEILRSFAAQIIDGLAELAPQVDIMVAMSIQGGIAGALEAAEDTGLNSDQIASIKAGAQNILATTASSLAGISLADVLANSAFASLLEQSLEGPDLVSLDDPILTQLSDLFTQASDPVLVDTDNDGLFDIEEEVHGSDPNNPDTDGDLLKDGAEVNIYGVSPINNDSDGDGVTDAVEVGLGEDPAVAGVFGPDSDNDGLPDSFEAIIGTNPKVNDTDGDGWWDGFEIGVGSGLLTVDANNPLFKNVRIEGTGFTVSPVGNLKPQAWLLNAK
jgi:gas vesicle protein